MPFVAIPLIRKTIVPLIKDVDVLYHESTFLEAHAHLCVRTKHSTAKQAATIALKANVKTINFRTLLDSLWWASRF